MFWPFVALTVILAIALVIAAFVAYPHRVPAREVVRTRLRMEDRRG